MKTTQVNPIDLRNATRRAQAGHYGMRIAAIIYFAAGFSLAALIGVIVRGEFTELGKALALAIVTNAGALGLAYDGLRSTTPRWKTPRWKPSQGLLPFSWMGSSLFMVGVVYALGFMGGIVAIFAGG
jgi:hypothetical protein